MRAPEAQRLKDPVKENIRLKLLLNGPVEALWQPNRDRWLVEKPPPAAKQILAAPRASVFAKGSWRLSELALLGGNIVTESVRYYLYAAPADDVRFPSEPVSALPTP